MNMAMAAWPATATAAPTAYQAKRWDAKQRRHKKRKNSDQEYMRRSMSGLSDSGLGGLSGWWDALFGAQYQQRAPYLPTYYTRPPITSSLPAYNYGYYGYRYPMPQYQYQYPYRQYPYQYQSPYQYQYGYGYPYYGSGYGYGYNPGTNLPGGDQYLYLRTPQQCVGQGGIWDAFSQSCSNPNSGTPVTPSPVPTTPSGAPPSVLGYSKFAAANMLNAAGWEVWLVQEDGGNFSPPQGYDPRRALIWVSNGIVQRQGVG